MHVVAAVYLSPDSPHPKAWNSGSTAVQHTCDGPTCTINPDTGYYAMDKGNQRMASSITGFADLSITYLAGFSISAKYCIVPQGARGDGSLWDILYEWTLQEAGNTATALGDRVFFKYCGLLAPVSFSRGRTYVINNTQAHGDLALMFSAVNPDGRAVAYQNGVSYWLDGSQVSWAHYPKLHKSAKKKEVIFKPTESEPAVLYYAAYNLPMGGTATVTDVIPPT